MKKSHVFKTLALFTLIVGVSAFIWKITREPAITIDVIRDVEYAVVDDQALLLDLYLPSRPTSDRPVIIFLHGGAWKWGSKADTGPARFLIWEGYALATINYRLVPHATYPAPLHDAKAAVRWLRANAKKYGLDPDRIIISGASSGAQLASLVGVTNNNPHYEGNVGSDLGVSSTVQGVLSYFGSSDLTAYANRIGDSPQVVGDYLGGPIAGRMELAREASPAFNISVDSAPILILHGEADDIVPVDQARILHKAYQNAGRPAELLIYEDAGHDQKRFKAKDCKVRVRAFLNQHLH